MTHLTREPLVRLADLAPDAPALRATAACWTWAELLTEVDRLAVTLTHAGVEPGARVACLLDDTAQSVMLMHAVRRACAVLVPLNRRAADAEVSYQLEFADVALVVTDRVHTARATSAAGQGRGTRCAVRDIARLTDATIAGRRDRLRDDVDLDDIATVVFTSGTTGRPKAALLSHGNHAASATAWRAVLRPGAADRWLACLPLFHVAGLAMVHRALWWGNELEIQAGFDARAVSDAIEQGATLLSLVPTQLQALLDERQGRQAPDTLRALLLGGGPISGPLLAHARDLGYRVLTTYGMTETASGVAVGGAEPATPDDPSALRALPGVDVRIGEADEIELRGGMVFSGYLNSETATAEALHDGWLRSGDLGSLESDGLLRISDRRDDLIISGGENVYPAEIEAVLQQAPGVNEVAVTGQPHPRWGAVPVAFFTPTPGMETDDARLRGHCLAHLAPFKVPVRFYRVAGLPRDDLGKVRRHALTALIDESAP